MDRTATTRPGIMTLLSAVAVGMSCYGQREAVPAEHPNRSPVAGWYILESIDARPLPVLLNKVQSGSEPSRYNIEVQWAHTVLEPDGVWKGWTCNEMVGQDGSRLNRVVAHTEGQYRVWDGRIYTMGYGDAPRESTLVLRRGRQLEMESGGYQFAYRESAHPVALPDC